MPGSRFQRYYRLHEAKAFTLLEICFALFIIVLLLGLGVGATSSLFAESRLRTPATRILVLAKTARRLAISERKPYELRFSDHLFTIGPLEEKKDEDKSKESKELPKAWSYRVSKTLGCQLMRWNEKKWEKPGGSWIFQPSGICEPISLRFSESKSWLAITFNPLTASIQEESYELH